MAAGAFSVHRDEKLEECGIVGIVSKKGEDVAPFLYRALIALQHRGQDAAGLAVYDGKRIHTRHGLGLVSDIFGPKDLQARGSIGIGHTRYPTIGVCRIQDVQPSVSAQVGVVHNGHVANYEDLKKKLEGRGHKFGSTVDSEPMMFVLNDHGEDIEGGVREILDTFEGSFSDAAIHHGKMAIYRDRLSLRPLVWGENEEFICFASETVALDINGVPYSGEVLGGELVVVDGGKMQRKRLVDGTPKHCMFEYVYFSRPDSVINGDSVFRVRTRLGQQLASEQPVKADVVVPVPDTSRTAAAAFAKSLCIEVSEGLMKNRYIGRTFIMPSQEKRVEAVRLKLNPVRDVIAGKRIVLVDDSIVRGTTLKEIVALVRAAGAKEVHVRITSPPIKAPCFYGVDMSTYEELIANSKSVDETRAFIGADSLGYLSLDGLKKAIDAPICSACLDGKYHTEFVRKLADSRKGGASGCG